MVYIETKRLILRDWKDEDKEIFQEMNADETVMKFFLNPLSHHETDRFLQNIEQELKVEGYGLYAVEVKDTGDFIGFIGFHKVVFPSDFTPCIEIGWRLVQKAWNKGYATEGAKACLDYGLNVLGLNEIYSFTSIFNTQSQNIMKKIGLQFVQEFNHPSINRDHSLCSHVLYSVKKENKH